EGERAVLELIAVDQLTLTEAAAALGIRQVTARVRLHRARRALRGVAVAEPADGPRGTSLPYAASCATGVNGGEA
ncbi:sigma factor-like helix-turn-helix DNA-binding protein, partial [Streptomyces pharetrae]